MIEPDQTSTTTTSTLVTTSSTGAPVEPEPVDPSTTTIVESVEPEPSTTQASVAPVPCGLGVTILFDEGAPRDRILISNESTTDIAIASARIDLSNSAGAIIFDTLDGGSGVEVFQDFQIEGGEAVLANEPVAEDGATDLLLEFDSFNSGESTTFSIDVDDQLLDSDLGQIQVTGAEIAGAQVVLTIAGGGEATAIFDQENSAQVLASC